MTPDPSAPAGAQERTVSADLRRLIPAVRRVRRSDVEFDPMRLANLMSNAANGLEWAERMGRTPQDREPQGKGLVERLAEHDRKLNDPRRPWGYEDALRLSRDLKEAVRALSAPAEATEDHPGIADLEYVYGATDATERAEQGEAREPDAWLAEVAGAPDRSRPFPSQKEATDHIVRCAPGGQPDRLAGRVIPLYRAPAAPAEGELREAPEWLATPEDFAEHLIHIGWEPFGDAQWDKIREVWRALAAGVQQGER